VLSRAEKTTQVDTMREDFARATSVFVTEFSGITVQDFESLRGQMHDAGAGDYDYRITKNTVLRLAAEGSDVDQVKDSFSGPTAIAMSYADPVSLAKMLVDFETAHEGFILKAGVLDGKVLSEAEIKTLATLPSMDELRGKLVGLIQAPATKIARLLNEPGGQIARVLSARAQQSE
jgi:large subunit ribosomal protein L10